MDIAQVILTHMMILMTLGTELMEYLITQSHNYLKPGGRLVLNISSLARLEMEPLLDCLAQQPGRCRVYNLAQTSLSHTHTLSLYVSVCIGVCICLKKTIYLKNCTSIIITSWP